MRFRIRAYPIAIAIEITIASAAAEEAVRGEISRLLVTLTYMTETLRWHALINGIRSLAVLPPRFLSLSLPLSLALVLVTRSRHTHGLQAPKTE